MSSIESGKRKAAIGTSMTLKVNTGNFETVEVSKHVYVEVDFEKPEDNIAKSRSMDRVVVRLLREEADCIMKELNRSRMAKVGGYEYKVGLDADWRPEKAKDEKPAGKPGE
jgi:hypothetical protein